MDDGRSSGSFDRATGLFAAGVVERFGDGSDCGIEDSCASVEDFSEEAGSCAEGGACQVEDERGLETRAGFVATSEEWWR